MKAVTALLLVSLLLVNNGSRALDVALPVCESDVCQDYVKMLNKNMDTSINPCEDFYTYNCGNFIKSYTLNKNESSQNNFKILEEQTNDILDTLLKQPVNLVADDLWNRNAKRFYQSCIDLNKVNTTTVDYVLKTLNTKLGGWPLLTGEDNKYSPLDLFALLYKYEYSPIVSFGISTNPLNVTQRIIHVFQPGYIAYKYYNTTEFQTAYKDYYRTVIKYLNESVQVNETEIEQVLELEMKLAEIQLSRDDLRVGARNLQMPVADLQAIIPDFPWVEFVTNKMFANVSSVQVTDQELISVNDRLYLEKMQTIYDDYSKNNPRTLANFLIGGFFYNSLSPFLPEHFLTARLNISQLRDGITELPNRINYCINLANDLIFTELGRMYVQKTFNDEIKQRVANMTTEIQNAFEEILSSERVSSWMDAESREKAIEKAKLIEPRIGYPDYYNSEKYVENNFQYILNEENFLKNALTIYKVRNRHQNLARLREPVEDEFWPYSAAIVNAFYQPDTNRIYLPAAILRPPVYTFGVPRYVNFASIGMIIAHEITHAFDDEGRKYDSQGKYIPDGAPGLWSNATIESFKNKIQCITDQYDNYFVINYEGVKYNINGTQTRGENIADNGGLKASFKAAENLNLFDTATLATSFTPRQMFFISTAQLWCTVMSDPLAAWAAIEGYHSVPKYRVNGIMKNSIPFHEAFNCPIEKDCSVW